jgi:hypothetical protein
MQISQIEARESDGDRSAHDQGKGQEPEHDLREDLRRRRLGIEILERDHRHCLP